MTSTTTFDFDFEIMALGSGLVPGYSLMLRFPKYEALTHSFGNTLHSPEQLQNSKIKLGILRPVKDLTCEVNKLMCSCLVQ